MTEPPDLQLLIDVDQQLADRVHLRILRLVPVDSAQQADHIGIDRRWLCPVAPQTPRGYGMSLARKVAEELVEQRRGLLHPFQLTALLRGESLDPAMRFACAVGAQNLSAADSISGVQDWERTAREVGSRAVKNPLGIDLPGWRFDEGEDHWVGPRDAAAGT